MSDAVQFVLVVAVVVGVLITFAIILNSILEYGLPDIRWWFRRPQPTQPEHDVCEECGVWMSPRHSRTRRVDGYPKIYCATHTPMWDEMWTSYYDTSRKTYYRKMSCDEDGNPIGYSKVG